MQQALTAAGFPAPRLIPTRSTGNTLLQLKGNAYEMFEFVAGEGYARSPAQTRAAGEMLARFHEATANFAQIEFAPSGDYHDATAIRTGLCAISSGLSSHDSFTGDEAELVSLIQTLIATYDRAAEAVDATGFAAWEPRILHADWHPGNLMFRRNEVVAVIDYDSVRRSQRVIDVANGVLQFSMRGEGDPATWPPELDQKRLAVTLRTRRILGLSVAGQTVAPEKAPAAQGGNTEDVTYFINVARTAGSDEPFQIAAVFEMPRPEESLKITDLLHLPLPRFEDGVKFQKVFVRIWVPRDYRLVGDPDGFTSHIGVGLLDSRAITAASDDPNRWFAKDATPFDFQVGGTDYLFSSLTGPKELDIGYWHIPTMTTIASLVALLLGVVLLRFSLQTKVFAILFVAFIVLFVRLFSPSLANSWLLAARLGIAGVIALWLVAWLLYVRRTAYARSALALQGADAGGSSVGEATPVSASPVTSDAPDAQQSGDKTDKPERDSDAQ